MLVLSSHVLSVRNGKIDGRSIVTMNFVSHQYSDEVKELLLEKRLDSRRIHTYVDEAVWSSHHSTKQDDGDWHLYLELIFSICHFSAEGKKEK